MSMRNLRGASDWGQLGALVGGAWLASCSGAVAPSFDSNVPACSPGAPLDGGTCDGSGPASVNNDHPADASRDSSSPPADSAADADASRLADRDAAADASPDAPHSPPDMCPVEPGPRFVFLDCDPKCSPRTLADCAQTTCAPAPRLTLGWTQSTPLTLPYVLRTPDEPGVDPNCEAQCPGQGFAYGLGFKVDASRSGALQLKVAPPWFIIVATETPYCADQHAAPPQQCIWISSTDPRPIYIMTKDPQAPARNVYADAQPDPNMACP
jgi:hypothetical protein